MALEQICRSWPCSVGLACECAAPNNTLEDRQQNNIHSELKAQKQSPEHIPSWVRSQLQSNSRTLQPNMTPQNFCSYILAVRVSVAKEAMPSVCWMRGEQARWTIFVMIHKQALQKHTRRELSLQKCVMHVLIISAEGLGCIPAEQLVK